MIQVYKKNELFIIENTVTDIIYPNLTREEALVLLKKFDRDEPENRCDFAIKEDNVSFEYASIDDKDQQITSLEAKLAESEKKAYSRGHSQRDIANEIKLNALREDVANKEKRIVELKQQLAEKEKENTKLKEVVDCVDKLKQFNADMKNYALVNRDVADEIYCEHQDKISFAVEQLEKMKELLNTDFESTISWIDPYEDGEYLNSMTYNHNNTIKIIDNQIKQLKEMK